MFLDGRQAVGIIIKELSENSENHGKFFKYMGINHLDLNSLIK